MPSVGYGDWEPKNDKHGRRNKTEQTNPAAVQGRREDKRRHRLAAAGGDPDAPASAGQLAPWASSCNAA